MIDPISLEKIRIITIQALVSDDELMDRLRFKGGNALELVYRIAERASLDLDFSIQGKFDDNELESIKARIEERIVQQFKENEYIALDINMKKRPSSVKPELADFWGGYVIEFKIIEANKFDRLKNDLSAVRRNTLQVGKDNSTVLKVEISSYEFCPYPEETKLNGYTVHVYSLPLIAIEKLRAICQQLKDYKQIVFTAQRTPRARDFFDIYVICEKCKVDLYQAVNLQLVPHVFLAKKVPIEYLSKMEEDREYHRIDYPSLVSSLKSGVEQMEFDFYFDYVKELAQRITSLLDN